MGSTSRIVAAVIIQVFIIFLIFLPSIILIVGKIKPFQRGFFCDDESIRYPFKKNTVSSTLAIFIGGVGSTFIIAISEIVINRNFICDSSLHYQSVPQDNSNGNWINKQVVVNIYKYCGIFIFGTAFDQMITNGCKYSIGRLRPHFISACNLDFSRVDCSNFNYVMINDSFCNQPDEHRLKDMRLSFPSGHSSFSAYCAVAFSIYLMKRWKNMGSLVVLRSFSQAVSILLALLCGLSRISDYKHHPTDVLAGLVSGTLIAFCVWFGLLDWFEKPKPGSSNDPDSDEHFQKGSSSGTFPVKHERKRRLSSPAHEVP